MVHAPKELSERQMKACSVQIIEFESLFFVSPPLPFLIDIFKHDPEFVENEEKYKAIRAEILGEESSGSEESGSDEESGEDSDEEQEEGGKMTRLD